MKRHFIIDPEFQRLIPTLSSKEKELLEMSILRDGCREPLTIWNNIVLDGHNRLAICTSHNLSFEVRSIQLQSRDDAVAWICVNQMGRRNISEETRRYLIGKRFEAEKRIGARNASGLNQYSGNELSPTLLGKAPEIDASRYGVSARIGQEYHLSHTTVEKYARYAKAIDRISKADAAIIPQILSGNTRIGQDNIIDIADLSDEQIQAVTSSIPDEFGYHLDRDRIITSLRRIPKKHSPHRNPPKLMVPSVKDMPSYDPDAEISSLTLTIPSWCSSLSRAISHADLQAVTDHARKNLHHELFRLMKTIQGILDDLQENNHDE
ncbi:MAG TPA: hypothetical protein P5559_02685 [Candidatus Limiplasma sp.]|nr:hypothetical protein [Candidatus Limiplasma sp.]